MDTTTENKTFSPEGTDAPAAESNSLVRFVKSLFHFKTEKLRDDTGKVIGDGKKHPSVTLDLPVPSRKMLATMLLESEKYNKELELLDATILDMVYRVARGQINDYRENTKDAVVTAASLNYDKLSWTAIANMPKGERASTVPSDEDIKAFLDSYLLVMPGALNKPKQNIENHLLCFQSSFKKQRSQKEILEMFVNALLVYVTSAGAEAVEEHGEVIEYYQNRLKKMLTSEEKITLDNL